LVDVLSRAEGIDDDAPANEFKQDAVVADAQPVFVRTAAQFLHIAAEVLLQAVEAKANLSANVFGQGPQCRLGFAFDFKLVFHRSGWRDESKRGAICRG